MMMPNIAVRAQKMAPPSCDGCPVKSNSMSVAGVRDLLEKDWTTCGTCPHEPDLRRVAQQFRLHRPKWWVVNGRTVIPMWVIENLRNLRYEG